MLYRFDPHSKVLKQWRYSCFMSQETKSRCHPQVVEQFRRHLSFKFTVIP